MISSFYKQAIPVFENSALLCLWFGKSMEYDYSHVIINPD